MYNDDWRPEASVKEPRRAERSARSVSSRSREAFIEVGEVRGGRREGSAETIRCGADAAAVGAEINQEQGKE